MDKNPNTGRYVPKWTYELAASEAAKFSTRQEFMKQNRGPYSYLKRTGRLNEACAHMPNLRPNYTVWDRESAFAEAKKYQRKGDFRAGSTGALIWLEKHGLADEACAHMPKRSMTKEEILAEARKYRDQTEFKQNNLNAYMRAWKKGWHKEAVAHMPPPMTGFRDHLPGTLYFIELDMGAGGKLYKAGITNLPVQRRINGMGVPKSIKVTILKTVHFPNGKDARDAENDLFIRFSDYWYDGPPVMANGNTELFTVNILTLLGDLLEPLAA